MICYTGFGIEFHQILSPNCHQQLHLWYVGIANYYITEYKVTVQHVPQLIDSNTSLQ